MQKNRIEVAGYLVSKPELRTLPSRVKVANVKLGESHTVRHHDGTTERLTNWYDLVFYDRLAEQAVAYEKGDNVWVEGRLERRTFTPKDGSTRTVSEINVQSSHQIAPLRPVDAKPVGAVAAVESVVEKLPAPTEPAANGQPGEQEVIYGWPLDN
jgi:single stranded DNA-binding protein